MANWGDEGLSFFSDEELAEIEEYKQERAGQFMSMDKRAAIKKYKEDNKRWEAWREANPEVSGRITQKEAKESSKQLKADMKAAIKRDKAAGGKGEAKQWIQWSEDGSRVEQKWGTYDEWKETDAYAKYAQKRDFKLGNPEAWKSTENQWMQNREPKKWAEYRVKKMMQKYSPSNKHYNPETDREKYLYYKDVSAKIRKVGTTSREDIYKNMNKAEASSMANAYEPGLFTTGNAFNTQATRDVGGGTSGLIGNEKAGNAVYNPKSNTRTAVSKLIKSRGQKLTESRKAQGLDRAKERLF